jgi:hypothetical protein
MSFDHGGYDPRTIDGNKAVTTQPFTELNSKRGMQYEAAFYLASLAVSTSTDIIIQVGSINPVLIKDINVQFNSQWVSAQLFLGPSFTGGTSLDVYNLNDAGAVAGDVTLLSGATVSDPGTAVSPQIVSIGTENLGKRAVSSVAGGVGVERVLAAGATYCYRITNLDTVNTAEITGVATWYQGPLSVDQ